MSDHSFGHLGEMERALRKERRRCACMRLSDHPPHQGRCGRLYEHVLVAGRGIPVAAAECSCSGTLDDADEEKGYPA